MRIVDNARRYGGPVGPPATRTGEPGQARKGAAVVRDVGAGVWLAGPPPFLKAKSDVCYLLFDVC